MSPISFSIMETTNEWKIVRIAIHPWGRVVRNILCSGYKQEAPMWVRKTSKDLEVFVSSLPKSVIFQEDHIICVYLLNEILKHGIGYLPSVERSTDVASGLWLAPQIKDIKKPHKRNVYLVFKHLTMKRQPWYSTTNTTFTICAGHRKRNSITKA